jgi:thiol-disulfide isomerase/thioredoxin
MTETQTRNTAHAIGAADAPVTVVEYGDYQCPYCARAKPVLEELVERAGDKVRLVFRHYPLDSVHPLARRAAEAAEAAGAQGSFWPMHDLLYENQDDLEEGDLRSYAVRLELDLARFDEDMTGSRHAGRVEEDRLSGIRDGVRGTLGIFLDGVPYNGRLEMRRCSGRSRRPRQRTGSRTVRRPGRPARSGASGTGTGSRIPSARSARKSAASTTGPSRRSWS